jgi:hypothetical protein
MVVVVSGAAARAVEGGIGADTLVLRDCGAAQQ